MPLTYEAPFAQATKTASAYVKDALATTTTTGGLNGTVLLMTAGSDGAIVTRVTAIPIFSVVASGLVLGIKKANATIIWLFDSTFAPAWTSSTAQAFPAINFDRISRDNPLELEAGDQLYVGTRVALEYGYTFTAAWKNF